MVICRSIEEAYILSFFLNNSCIMVKTDLYRQSFRTKLYININFIIYAKPKGNSPLSSEESIMYESVPGGYESYRYRLQIVFRQSLNTLLHSIGWRKRPPLKGPLSQIGSFRRLLQNLFLYQNCKKWQRSKGKRLSLNAN